jgi:predicted peptidase
MIRPLGVAVLSATASAASPVEVAWQWESVMVSPAFEKRIQSSVLGEPVGGNPVVGNRLVKEPPSAATEVKGEPRLERWPDVARGETSVKSSDGGIEATYRYRLVEPVTALAAEPRSRFPLIVFLHGSGERGSDNESQLLHFAGWCSTREMQSAHPCFVLAMQCPSDESWSAIDIKGIRERGETPRFSPSPTRAMRALMQAVDDVARTKAVDPDRIYLTGLSMGGFGAFDLAARRPTQFACVVPICGGGDPKTAAVLASTPFYIVHGRDDSVVPAALSRTMNEAIVKASSDRTRDGRDVAPDAGGASVPVTAPKHAPNPMYAEYAGVGHDAWTPAYRLGDAGVLDWMFAQRKRGAGDAAR